jgi:hypothetical protein
MFSGKIFRSRYAALFWAAGILWTAYDVAEANTPSKAPAPHHAAGTTIAPGAANATGTGVSAQALAVLANYAAGN